MCDVLDKEEARGKLNTFYNRKQYNVGINYEQHRYVN